MELKTLTEIKDEIALNNGYTTWFSLIDSYPHSTMTPEKLDELENEATKLYALQIAEAACKEQRIECFSKIPLGAIYREYYLDTRNAVYNAPQPDIDELLK